MKYIIKTSKMMFAFYLLILANTFLNAQVSFDNLGFETINKDAPDELVNWQLGNKTTATISDNSASGNSSLLISGTYTEQNAGFFYQHLPFTIDKLQQFKISAKIKTESVVNGAAGVYAYGKINDQFVGYTTKDFISDNTDWQECSIYVWLDERIDHFRIGGHLSGSGKAYFDDFSITAVTPSEKPLAPEVNTYLDAIIKIVEENSFYGHSKNIKKFSTDLKTMCSGLNTIDDCQPALSYYLNKIDNHSFIMVATQSTEWQNSGENNTPKAIALTTGHLIEDHFGYLSMPGVSTGDINTQVYFANEMQKLIAQLDGKHIKGWILDLRENIGGNCWPMLAGIGPILGEGINGYFLSEKGNNKWSYQNGSSMHDDDLMVTVSDVPYVLKMKNPPVAVLTGPKTSSSGEVVTIAFRKRPLTKSFGTTTGGYTTGNSRFDLPDGGILLLATSVYADREMVTYDKNVVPDIQINEDKTEKQDPVLDAALLWLKKIED